tara:strand:+ start:2690 stop:3025 length:336 start_codon:yes stop_codon:yes gene_type:complete
MKEKTMKNFKQGYKDFKVWHTHKMNITFHFLTSIIQLYFLYLFIINFNPLYILGVLLIPFITDSIGHLIEKNFGMVLLLSKMSKSTNSAGVNGFYNFCYRIMLWWETSFKK